MNKTFGFALFAVTVALPIISIAATPGEVVFQKKCKACHVVKGSGGKMGPELTKIGATRKPAFLAEKIDDPKKSTPSSTMPSFKSLSQKDKAALVDYMKTLK